MPRFAWSRRGRSTEMGEHAELAEAAGLTVAHSLPSPKGFVDDVPLGGTTKYNPGGGYPDDRRLFMHELYGAYLACPWSSVSVDIVARTSTAGGVEMVPEAESDDDIAAAKANMPVEVRQLQALLDYVNPREDIRQLKRGQLMDLQIFGDAFIEVVWLLGRPVALYSLDSPSMIPLADEHGTIRGYSQVLDGQRTVDFEPHEVIHVSLDAPRGGVYGVGPTQKAMVPITTWLFTAGALKEMARKGFPPDVLFNFDMAADGDEIKRWRQQYSVRKLGVPNIGNPLTGKNITPHELQQNKLAEILAILSASRDEIVATYGVPGRKVGIVEAGSLGGTGTEAWQDKTFRVNTCGPLQETVLEKDNFHLTAEAFGIHGWRMRFGDVDWRDDKVVDDIHSQRLRDGRWTLNKSRSVIGEEPVDGGDDPVLVDRQNLVLWSDIPALSHAAAAAASMAAAGGGQAGDEPGVGTDTDRSVPTRKAPKASASVKQEAAPEDPEEDGRVWPILDFAQRSQRGPAEEAAALEASWDKDFQRRRRQALRELPQPEEASA